MTATQVTIARTSRQDQLSRKSQDARRDARRSSPAWPNGSPVPTIPPSWTAT
jgi:hypothetical protein